ncbi:hypothetical protein AQUCO_00200966v1 [Aquilegia coerulea]|uniref:Response regulatory domain-containing protein n=1 Tax=Aquilegia coerulea TaxID=218851 RepID=A0A2G5F5J9_AQUCA|nr:hypothetical protein AQUCO_00200966v1 [Aquilegia coerulea]
MVISRYLLLKEKVSELEKEVGVRRKGKKELVSQLVVNLATFRLSNATTLQEAKKKTMATKEKFMDQKQALKQAQRGAFMAGQVRCIFQTVLSTAMPIQSLSSILLRLQESAFNKETKKVETIAKVWAQFERSLRPNFEFGGPSVARFSFRVLLADEDRFDRVVTQCLLERLGCKVTSVTSGIQCLEFLGDPQISFDIVMLELKMSDIDGLTLAKIIQANFSGLCPWIVSLVATYNEDVLERCSEAGIDAVLCKPLRLHGIEDAFGRLIEQTNNRLQIVKVRFIITYNYLQIVKVDLADGGYKGESFLMKKQKLLITRPLHLPE